MITNKDSKTKMPKVSIIVPAYNSGKFIQTLLNSLNEQTINDFETIVVNDGSSDNTIEVLNCYKTNEKISLKIVEQSNSGVSVARNTGLKNASGEFCIFIDSDDYVLPTFLEKLLKKQSETGSDIVYCGFCKKSNKSEKYYPEKFYDGNLLSKRISRDLLFHLGGVLIKREILTKEGLTFSTSLSLGEDLLFAYTLLAKNNFVSVPEYLYYQTYREDSVMNSQWSLEKYEHNAYAMSFIKESICNLLQERENGLVFNLLKNMEISARLKFLWKLMLSKKYNQLSQHLSDNSFKLSDIDLKNLKPKDRKKFNIIKSNNKFLWSVYVLFSKKQK